MSVYLYGDRGLENFNDKLIKFIKSGKEMNMTMSYSRFGWFRFKTIHYSSVKDLCTIKDTIYGNMIANGRYEDLTAGTLVIDKENIIYVKFTGEPSSKWVTDIQEAVRMLSEYTRELCDGIKKFTDTLSSGCNEFEIEFDEKVCNLRYEKELNRWVTIEAECGGSIALDKKTPYSYIKVISNNEELFRIDNCYGTTFASLLNVVSAGSIYQCV